MCPIALYGRKDIKKYDFISRNTITSHFLSRMSRKQGKSQQSAQIKAKGKEEAADPLYVPAGSDSEVRFFISYVVFRTPALVSDGAGHLRLLERCRRHMLRPC